MSGRRSSSRARWLVRSVLAGALLLLATLPLGPWLVRPRGLSAPDVILVLGSHEFERLPHAAQLARARPAAVVLLTQPVVATPQNCEDCARRPNRLVAAGVARARIHVAPRRVRNTWDELVTAREWLQTHQARSVLIVTSPYHTRRVGGLARVVLPADVQWGVAACPVAGGLAWPWWSRRYDRRYVVYELAALLDNSWRHRLAPHAWSAS